METYSWSDNIKQAVIKNQKGYSLIFNHEEIAPGETKVFTPVTHKQELFSPDCYNGKTLFTMGGGRRGEGRLRAQSMVKNSKEQGKCKQLTVVNRLILNF